MLTSNMKEHQDLYSISLKLYLALFAMCPDLDNWVFLLFFLFCVVKL